MIVRPRPGRKRIIEAYAKLLNEYGNSDFPLKQLVRRAQVNRSTFYYHFSCVQEVLDELMDSFITAFSEAFDGLEGDTEWHSREERPTGVTLPCSLYMMRGQSHVVAVDIS